MQELFNSLKKRRFIAMGVIILFALLAIVFSFNFEISSPTYFDEKYNMIFVYALIVYKLIELIIIYYFLFHRYLIRLKRNTYEKEHFSKLSKHTKLFYFLVPQGNTIFGLIAYKLSSSVLYFFPFTFIGLVTLIVVNPKILESHHKNRTLK